MVKTLDEIAKVLREAKEMQKSIVSLKPSEESVSGNKSAVLMLLIDYI